MVGKAAERNENNLKSFRDLGLGTSFARAQRRELAREENTLRAPDSVFEV